MYLFKIIRKTWTISLTLTLLLILSSLGNDVYGQSNRGKRKNNFSSIGRSHTYIRHGLTIHVGAGISASLKQSVSAVPMAGLGYTASQYYGISNRFMQQSITYQFGLGLDRGGYQVHNVVGTFHCSYIGSLDLNPFVYGIAMQFAYATPSERTIAYANFYVRPEIGIAFPAQYADRTKGIQRVTAMITYGFNIRTFYNHNMKMEEWIRATHANNNDPISSQANTTVEDVVLPWTAMNHHVITVRLNINLGNIREMRR